MIWNQISKSILVNISTLHFTVCDFNDGNVTSYQVLERLCITPGSFCTREVRQLDPRETRNSDEVNKYLSGISERRSRIRRELEETYQAAEGENSSYGPDCIR